MNFSLYENQLFPKQNKSFLKQEENFQILFYTYLAELTINYYVWFTPNCKQGSSIREWGWILGRAGIELASSPPSPPPPLIFLETFYKKTLKNRALHCCGGVGAVQDLCLPILRSLVRSSAWLRVKYLCDLSRCGSFSFPYLYSSRGR